MRPFVLFAAPAVRDVAEAARASAVDERDQPRVIAGGTVLLDLMKLDVLRPSTLIDISPLEEEFGAVRLDGDELRLGGLVKMAQAADHPELRRRCPVLTDSLWQAASPQIRNMASLAGNVLQATRCPYYRDVSWANCNKRSPGSGCAALEGVNRRHAVLGVSERCIAQYPGDFANALVALDAEADIARASGAQERVRVEDLHRAPGETPEREHNLDPGDLITGFIVRLEPWFARSLYLKVRDRASYDFALASSAVALDLGSDGIVRDVRIALGGVAVKPWRAREAEERLRGAPLDEAAAESAAAAAFEGAVVQENNAFKPALGRRTLVRALLETARMEVAHAR